MILLSVSCFSLGSLGIEADKVDNGAYGYMDGAQTDLFAGVGGSTGDLVSAASSSSSDSPLPSSSQDTPAASVTDADSTSTLSLSPASISTSTPSLAPSATYFDATSTDLPSPSTSSSLTKQCKRKTVSKRAIDRLANDPRAIKRHRERNERLRARRQDNRKGNEE